MNALALFDGMSCGQIALDKLGVKVDNYFASEIDKHAIKVTLDNYPDTIQVGDVTRWRDWDLLHGVDWAKIDLVLAGSPCQGFSFAGKQLAFDDPRSALFFTFVDILNHIKKVNPKVKFLLENVRMKKEYLDVISTYTGVEPIFINSALVSAQSRQRYYWTNIEGVEVPEDRGVLLKDVLICEDNPRAIRGRKLNKGVITGRRLDSRGVRQDYNKEIKTTQCLEVRKKNSEKSNCLTTVQKDNVLTPLPIGRHPNAFKDNLPFRYYTPIECERLQTVPDNYTKAVSDTQRYKMLGNGWTVDVIAHILKNL